MEIENGLNPNCSELVVRIDGWETDEEMRDVLRTLEEITGWKVGIVENLAENQKAYATPVDIEKVKYGNISEEEKDREFYPYIKIKDVIEGIEDEGKMAMELKGEGIASALAKGFWGRIGDKEGVPSSERKIPVGLIKYRERISREDHLLAEIRVNKGDGYEDHPAASARQHCYTPHFKPLAKIARKLPSNDVHVHDGGSPDDFVDWCRENGYDDVADKVSTW